MIPIHKVIWHEVTESKAPVRENEPFETMDDLAQVEAYVKAYEWGGPTSALQLYHIEQLSLMIRPGDTIVDLACGPGPLLLELAVLYPDCKFIGADLSPVMLKYLSDAAEARGLTNVTVLLEDIRTLPSLQNQKIDLVISTSALHHLPSETDLKMVFENMRHLLKGAGGFYLFDFALLRSEKARSIFVAEVAKLAPALTVKDYDSSLKAAFSMKTVLTLASEHLPTPFTAQRSAFVNFFYFLKSAKRAERSPLAKAKIDAIRKDLSFAMKLEYASLRYFSTKEKYDF